MPSLNTLHGLRCLSIGALAILLCSCQTRETSKANHPPPTRLSIHGQSWRLNDSPTYPGTPAEGLLMNVRMVNATFEDRRYPNFGADADANTEAFITRIPDYAASGVRAFTVSLQGGFPGYEGALNSAFEPDGSLRKSYLERVGRVIKSCDRQGLVIILSCFYQRQDQFLRNDDAVCAGVANVARWLEVEGFQNVMLEIANEFGHPGYDREILRRVGGMVELIHLARSIAPDLPVSTSGLGDGRIAREIAEAADFILLHFNHTAVGDIPERIGTLTSFHKPIVCNEDNKQGAEAAAAARASVAQGASWGLMLMELNQCVPFEFHGPRDDPHAYAAISDLTAPPDDNSLDR